MSKTNFYIPANLTSKRLAKSCGPYELDVETYSTKEGSWSYTRGIVRRGDQVIATVDRNYSSFPFLFITEHANGHDYMVCGSDYQGQTVIELDTGRRRDALSKGADKGHGFCWAESVYEEGQKILVVEGCHWACPYEFRFFDFADPMEGWPEIQIEDPVDTDVRRPTFKGDELHVFDTQHASDDEDDAGDFDDDGDVLEAVAAAALKRPIDIHRIYRRNGLSFELLSTWMSEDRKRRDIEREAAHRRHEAFWADFKANDPLYAECQRLIQGLPAEDYAGHGWTHAAWCPHWTGEERTYNRRIVKQGTRGVTVDLGWAVQTGPIQLHRYRDGKSLDVLWFEHSVDGMRKAFAATRELL